MHAHIVNIANPGSYGEELSTMLKLNNLPAIKAPRNPPSGKITNINLEAEAISTMEEEEVDESTKEETVTRNKKEHVDRPEETRPEQLKATEIGLTIYTSGSTGWPKETLSKYRLLQ